VLFVAVILTHASSLIAEAELSKLKKQYRLAEGDRKSYNDKTQAEIRLQVQLLDTKYVEIRTDKY
jgi:hypothetical protein